MKSREISLLLIRGSKQFLAVILLLTIQVFTTSSAYSGAKSSEIKSSGTVAGLRVWRAPDHTRLVFDLSEAVDHKVFPLTNPDRLVIDIENTKLNADTSTLDFTSSPITSIRSGVHEKKNLRIVLDLKQAVRPRSFPLASNEKYGDRLVVDLYDHNTETSKTVEDITAENSQRDIVIAIDAGHGGKDPGAIGPKGHNEKGIVLAIAQKLDAELRKMKGFKPILP